MRPGSPSLRQPSPGIRTDAWRQLGRTIAEQLIAQGLPASRAYAGNPGILPPPARNTHRATQLQPQLRPAHHPAGVPEITVHGARKTCGSLLATLDVHPRVAMQYWGTAKSP
jgi:hypothetical protein